jgi:CheY-like chemotaxis protein
MAKSINMKRAVKVLLIEDDELSQIEVQRFLRKRNIYHYLAVAKNGEEAIKFLEQRSVLVFQGNPDLILLDLNMPKVNGLEFLGILRADHRFDNIKIFILTTSDDDKDREATKKFGVAGFITKPLKIESYSSRDALNLMIDLMNI